MRRMCSAPHARPAARRRPFSATTLKELCRLLCLAKCSNRARLRLGADFGQPDFEDFIHIRQARLVVGWLVGWVVGWVVEGVVEWLFYWLEGWVMGWLCVGWDTPLAHSLSSPTEVSQGPKNALWHGRVHNARMTRFI